MKNIKLFISFLVLISYSSNAQTEGERNIIIKETNKDQLTSLSTSLKNTYDANKAFALQLAVTNSWPLTKTDADGSTLILDGVTSDLQPIYVTILNFGGAVTTRADKLYSGGGMGLSVEGDNMLAAVWDQGCGKVDHEIFQGRLTVMDGSVIATGSTAYHATHVCGTVIGTGLFNLPARGIAFKANLHSYDFGADGSEMATAASNALLLSNHSYAHTIASTYDYYAQTSDLIMQNAPYYMAIYAAGNHATINLPGDQINNDGCSKNSMTVANIYGITAYTGPVCIVAAPSSSWGPSDDFRIKPDICAKGRTVLSSTQVATNSYGTYNGTSMAAPMVTGTLLLLQQHYKNVKGFYMKAATLKGLAIHTADEAGNNLGPDTRFGWGLINAEAAANVISSPPVTAVIEENTLINANTFSENFTVSGGMVPFKVTICWTDPAGAIQSGNNNPTPTLVNDLDLRVISSTGTISYPWKLDISNPTGPALLGDNTRDNVEKIELIGLTPDEIYTVQITHKGILQSSLNQNFSLIVTGIRSMPCSQILSVTTNVVGTSVDNRQASVYINASNTISNTAVGVYHAGSQVLLTNGFTSEVGSVFRAYIEGCTNNFVRSKQIPNGDYTENSENDKIILSEAQSLLEEKEMNVVPNPTTGIINVQHTAEIKKLQVYNLFGKLMVEIDANSEGKTEIDLSSLPAGIYLLNTDEKMQQRIVKL